jgi:acetyltransferase-like isoleucine patch superfamily enzyme
MTRLRTWIGSTALLSSGAIVRTVNKGFSLLFSGAFASFGRQSVLQLPIRLGGTRRIVIGERVFVGASSWLEAVGEGDGMPALIIGDGTSMSGMAHITAAQSVRIGRNVLLARNVYISDHNHRFEDPETPILSQGILEPRPVLVGDGAWLGENVVVLPGVTIGRGAVVGANAVVLSDVPERCVAVGAPARVIRTLDGSGNSR